MAQFFLAACYEKGKGVEQDKMMALAWYGLAAEQGYPGAVEAINRLSGTMSENERKKAMAFRTRFQGTTVDCSRL
jgi:TPR repeat protein